MSSGADAKHPVVIEELSVRVSINSDDAVVEVDQSLYNPSRTGAPLRMIWPEPEGMSVSQFSCTRDEKPVPVRVATGFGAEVQYKRAAEASNDSRILSFIGHRSFTVDLGEVQRASRVRVQMRYRTKLAATGGVKWLRHPLSTNSLSPSPIRRFQLEVEAQTGEVAVSSPSHELTWKDSGASKVAVVTKDSVRLHRDLILRVGRGAELALKEYIGVADCSDAQTVEGQSVTVGNRAFVFKSGFWTEAGWNADRDTVRVKQFSPAYWELLWRIQGMKSVFGLGRKQRFYVQGSQVEVGEQGTTELLTEDRQKLGFPVVGEGKFEGRD